MLNFRDCIYIGMSSVTCPDFIVKSHNFLISTGLPILCAWAISSVVCLRYLLNTCKSAFSLTLGGSIYLPPSSEAPAVHRMDTDIREVEYLIVCPPFLLTNHPIPNYCQVNNGLTKPSKRTNKSILNNMWCLSKLRNYSIGKTDTRTSRLIKSVKMYWRYLRQCLNGLHKKHLLTQRFNSRIIPPSR